MTDPRDYITEEDRNQRLASDMKRANTAAAYLRNTIAAYNATVTALAKMECEVDAYIASDASKGGKGFIVLKSIKHEVEF